MISCLQVNQRVRYVMQDDGANGRGGRVNEITSSPFLTYNHQQRRGNESGHCQLEHDC